MYISLKRFVVVNRQHNSQHASRKPFAVGWLTRAHPQQRARAQFWARTYHATAQGHSAVLGAQPLVVAKSCCPISVRFQIGELAHAARPHNSQFYLI